MGLRSEWLAIGVVWDSWRMCYLKSFGEGRNILWRKKKRPWQTKKRLGSGWSCVHERINCWPLLVQWNCVTPGGWSKKAEDKASKTNGVGASWRNRVFATTLCLPHLYIIWKLYPCSLVIHFCCLGGLMVWDKTMMFRLCWSI